LPLITKQSQQTDVHTPILNTNSTQTKQRLNKQFSTHKEKPLDRTQLTHIDYSGSHPIQNLLIPLRRSSRLNGKGKTNGHNDAKVIKIGCRNTSYPTNSQHVEDKNCCDNAKSPSSLSPTSTPKKVRTIQDLYDHTQKIDALVADHRFEPEFAFSALGSPTTTSDVSDDPLTINEALQSPDRVEWHAAMAKELESLEANKTWTLVPLPMGRSPISCKWVLKKKLNPDGTVARYKARLVARGFSQVEGLDYSETFSPVLRMASFRLLMALATILDLEVHHLDVQTAFLHGDLPEEIYMSQPPGFESHSQPNYVCRLHRSLYGLKQSPRLWFQKFNNFMLSHGYSRLLSEPNIYIRHNHTSNRLLVVALYVDDIPIVGTPSEITQAKLELSKAFSITDLGPLSYFLGMQVCIIIVWAL
jgi:hypothetical protein